LGIKNVLQKWIDLRQTKTKMITNLYTYPQIHFTSKNASFCNICLSLSVCLLHIGAYISFTQCSNAVDVHIYGDLTTYTVVTGE